MSFGLCLSGGGIKGAAHIGVLQSLEEHNINIDYISGTSSGSIVATLYSIGYSPSEIYNFFKHYSKDITHIGFKNIFKLISGLLLKHKIVIDGLNDGKKLEKIMYKICAKKDIYTIDQINLPLLIPSVNIENGETYIFTSKKIRNIYQDNYVYDNSILVSKAVRASCSFPGIYSPCHYQNKILVDGGIRENIPWKETKKLGADTVLSVIFERTLEPDPFLDILEIITKSINLLSHELSLYEQSGSDYVLKINTLNTSLLDISKIDFLYNLGYSSMNNFLEKNNCNKKLCKFE